MAHSYYQTTEMAVGRILEILAPVARNMKSPITVIDRFEISAQKHPIYDMLQLIRRHGEHTTQLVEAEVCFSYTHSIELSG